MNRLPLSHEFEYRPIQPRLNPVCLGLTRLFGPRLRRKLQRIEETDIAGGDTIRSLLDRGDGVLLAPNHTDHGDSFMMLELGWRIGRPAYFMTAYQVLQGRRGWFLPRIGAFPVDREGADLRAFKMAVELLAGRRHPLVVFPEGEIHHLCDRVTPLREGAVAIATNAAKRAADAGKTIWIVPIGIKYRFRDGHDPMPAFHSVLDELERRIGWWVEPDRVPPLVQRIYRYAEAMLGLREFEYLGETRRGPRPPRLAHLREFLLGAIEAKRLPAAKLGGTDGKSVPERVKELRRACLDRLAEPGLEPEERRTLHRDLNDVFVAFQTFSYPGNYLREAPTLERASETLAKFEEDFLGVHEVTPHGPRKGVLRVGEPIDVREGLAAAAKPRQAVAALTEELERRIQGVLDHIGPGRPIPGSSSAARSEAMGRGA